MKKTTAKDLTTGNPTRLILGFFFPLVLGLLFQQFYSMVDTMIVGKTLGVNALAGVGSTGSVNFLVLGFCIGVCTGFAIPVAQKFGEKDEQGLRRYVGNMIWICVAFSVVLTVATVALCRNILIWTNTPDEVFREAYDYIVIIFLGLPVTILYNTLSGIIRSLGDARTPLYFLVFSSLLNVALDLLLILVIPMGVAGAAWATVISQLVSGILCLLFMAKRFPILHLSRDDMKLRGSYAGRLCAMGIPMGLQYSITAIGCLILQAAVNTLGAVSIAAMTAGGKVGNLMCCPLDAMGSTMATYGGQNLGAGRLDRIHKGLKSCLVMGCIYSVIAFVILWFFGRELSMLFLDRGETEILNGAREFLVLNSAFYIPLAFVNIVRFIIQGIGFSKLALFAGVFEMIARSAVSLLLVPVFGYAAVCLASPAAWILADCFLIPAYCYAMRTLKKAMADAVTMA